MAAQLRTECSNLQVEVIESRSVLGGGAAPGSTLPARALAIKTDSMNADQLCARLRQWATPIIARVEDNRVLLDLRTVEPAQEAVILAALESISK
jgi:L-seryl-tRNA(Ser) seleniumtransferase